MSDRSAPARSLARTLVLLLAPFSFAASAGGAQDAPAIVEELLTLSNEARSEEGIPPLTAHEGLARAAAGHADELARRGTLTHVSEDPDRRTPAARVARAGVALVEIAENVATIEGPDVAERTVGGWLESPGHRENLLNEAYTHVGHAVSVAEDGTSRIVQVLAARPLDRREARARPADGSDDVEIEIRYEEPDASLALFVDGEYQRGANVEPGVLRATVPAPAAPVEVGVGIDDGSGTIRMVERFELLPEAPPTLRPGAPSGETGDTSETGEAGEGAP